jgi:hypothetical protein
MRDKALLLLAAWMVAITGMAPPLGRSFAEEKGPAVATTNSQPATTSWAGIRIAIPKRGLGGLAVSRTGDRIAFSGQRESGIWELHIADLRSGKECMPPKLDFHLLSFSPDGKKVIMKSGELLDTIHLIDLNTMTEKQVAKGTCVFACWFGDNIVLWQTGNDESECQTMHLYNTKDGETKDLGIVGRPIAADPLSGMILAEVNPKAPTKRIGFPEFAQNTWLVLVKGKGQIARTIIPMSTVGMDTPVASPSLKFIAYESIPAGAPTTAPGREPSISRVNVETRQVETLDKDAEVLTPCESDMRIYGITRADMAVTVLNVSDSGRVIVEGNGVGMWHGDKSSILRENVRAVAVTGEMLYYVDPGGSVVKRMKIPSEK